MQPEVFYEHLCEELRENRGLYPYYKLTDGTPSQQLFRKAYFLQRLQYLDRHIDLSKGPKIWDCGCGYGTTGLFFAMKGQPVYGTTLEYYPDQWEKRRQFWSRFGDTSLLTCEYANLFDQPIEEKRYDYIILQDTLHHIEPLDEALPLFRKALKPDGKLLLIEENGGCWFKSAMLFAQRGRKRIITVHDDVLGKDVLMGNENIRPEKEWRKHFEKAGFRRDEESLQYIRCLPSFVFDEKNYEKNIEREQRIWKKSAFLRNHFYWGVNVSYSAGS
jgi:SAM-dependent methyltransferase